MLGLAGAALGACAPAMQVAPGPAVMVPSAGLNQQQFSALNDVEYALRPADVVSVTVFREQELSLERVIIAADGSVIMPLLGQVQAQGLTPGQFAGRLEGLLGNRYLRSPDVTVNVIEYASHIVTVEGAVERPGMYPFQPGTRLSGSIALAEGPTRVARGGEIAVFRQVEGGIEIAKFDYAALQAGAMLDPVLQPGDRVVVGTDRLSQFWQDFLTALPAFALFTRI
ncbi:MAG: polysaccharide export protein [Erythrobacter sp.]|nr:MAG: polysaccharide export protein [Erythrobacter sp.]